jgi:hypothetical protein
MLDTSLPISNKGTNGSPITDSNGNPLQGVEITLWRRVLNDTNSDGEGDEITDTRLLARTQTDSNGEYEFTSDDLPITYVEGGSEVIYYCTVHAVRVASGSGDPLDNGRIKSYDATNEPAASDYMTAYSLASEVDTVNLYARYYVPSNSYNDNDAINQINDETGNGRPLKQTTTSAQPEYRVGGLASQDAAYLDRTDDFLEADSPASDWTLFHDGSSWTLIAIVQPDSGLMLDDVSSFAATAGPTGADIGLNIAVDDRSSDGNDNVLAVRVNDGTGSDKILTSGDNAVPFDTPSIISVRHDGNKNYTAEVDNSQVLSGSLSLSFTSNDPTLPFSWTEHDGGTSADFPWGGLIGETLIYSSRKSDAETQDIVLNMADRWGYTL